MSYQYNLADISIIMIFLMKSNFVIFLLFHDAYYLLFLVSIWTGNLANLAIMFVFVIISIVYVSCYVAILFRDLSIVIKYSSIFLNYHCDY